MLLKYPMFCTTKSTNLHYLAFQSLHNNAAITEHSFNFNCCLHSRLTHYCSYACLHRDASAINYYYYYYNILKYLHLSTNYNNAGKRPLVEENLLALTTWVF